MDYHQPKSIGPQVLRPFDKALQVLALGPRWDLVHLPTDHFPTVRRLMLGLALGADSLAANWRLTQPLFAPQAQGVCYETLSDPQVNLLQILPALVPAHRTTPGDQLIIDATSTHIAGQHIAGTTLQYDHATRAYYMGHNLVTLFHRGTDGTGRFYDFALKLNHRQPPPQVHRGRPTKTVQQARQPRWKLGLELVQQAKQRGHQAGLVLADAEFCQPEFLLGVHQAGLDFTTRLPCNRLLAHRQGLHAAQHWVDITRSYKRLRDTGYYFMQTLAYLPIVGLPLVKVVAHWPCTSAKGKHDARFIVTSKWWQSAYEVVTEYPQRGHVEPGYKQLKQLCGLDDGHVRGWHAVRNYYALSLLTHAVVVEMHRLAGTKQGLQGYVDSFRQQLVSDRITAEKRLKVEVFKTMLWQNGFSTRPADHRLLLDLVDAAFHDTG